MTTWNEYVETTGKTPEWPYPVAYAKESLVAADVLIIGGGVAGCHAAISAARNGAKVVLAETGNVKRGGSGGAGVDHWHGAVTNPCSKVTPLDYTEACMESDHGHSNGIARYIICSEGWDTLLECEEMGVQIRDVKDEFKGADFRDEETKLMFAYDYENKHILRVWGYNIKPCLYYEMKRQGVAIYNRTLVTALLPRKGAGKEAGLWVRPASTTGPANSCLPGQGHYPCDRRRGATLPFRPEHDGAGSMSNTNGSGAGHAIGWNAGAEVVQMEQAGPGALNGFGYAPYSMGNASKNTYHGTSIVDADGKEVPWFDPYGREESKTVRDSSFPPLSRGSNSVSASELPISTRSIT